MEGGEKKPLLKGQTATRRLLMIRSCFCIIVIFISISPTKADKKTKRKRNKRWLCVSGLCLCRSLLVFLVGAVRWAAVAIFAL